MRANWMPSGRPLVSIRRRLMWRPGLGLANGAFEDSDEEAESVVEEFFPEGEASPESGNSPPLGNVPESMGKPSLRDKLDQRALQTAPVVLADPELT